MDARFGSHSLYRLFSAVLLASLVLAGLNFSTVPVAHALASYQYDFGTSTSPVAAGYTRVTESTLYSSGSFGWTDTSTLESRDRGAPAALTQDFVMSESAARTFQTDIPNGNYAVTLTMGDNDYGFNNMGVSANGVTVLPSVTTTAGVFAVNTFNVSVSGGSLSLQFSPGGGADTTWVVNGVAIVLIPPSSKYDFGTSTSPVAAGYTQVTEATAYSPGGFGWTDTSTLESRDRGAPAALTQDFVMSESAARTFKTDLANGNYAVTLTMGDNDYGFNNMGVSANAVTVLPSVSTTAGVFAVNTFNVSVSGGSLSLQFSPGGGADTTWVVNGVSIVLIPPSTKYDFGTSTSPVAAGYTQVTEATAYAPGGFGWTDTSTLESRDRGAPDALTQDFVMSESSVARTFKTDLANGTYAVTVTMGDNDYGFNNMKVAANGVTVLPSVSTTAGVFAVNTFVVTVSGGSLSLQFSPGGGADTTWVVNGVSFTAVPPPPTSAKFDFGTSSSPVAAGYTQVTEATAYAPGSFGWTDNTTLESRDRLAPADDLKRDFVLSSSAARTFKTDLANGTYSVVLIMGDNSFAHDNMMVAANGVTMLPSVTTAAGVFAVNSFLVTVSGGSLSLQFSDSGGADPTWVVNAVTVTQSVSHHVNIGSVGAQDGWILESAQGSGVGGSLNTTNTSLIVGDNTQNRQYLSILSFSTATLPDRAVITNAVLKVRSQGKAGSPWSLGNILLDMKSGTFGTKSLQVTDFQAAAGMSAVGMIVRPPLANNWYNMSVPSSAFSLINKVGITQFRLRYATASSINSANDYMLFYSGDITPTGNRPTLMIDYYIP